MATVAKPVRHGLCGLNGKFVDACRTSGRKIEMPLAEWTALAAAVFYARRAKEALLAMEPEKRWVCVELLFSGRDTDMRDSELIAADFLERECQPNELELLEEASAPRAARRLAFQRLEKIDSKFREATDCVSIARADICSGLHDIRYQGPDKYGGETVST